MHNQVSNSVWLILKPFFDYNVESPACGARSKTTIVRKPQWGKLFFNRYLAHIAGKCKLYA